MKDLQEVEFTCPRCGTRWLEWQDPDDDWFKLATNQTLCANCGQVAMRRIISKMEQNKEQ